MKLFATEISAIDPLRTHDGLVTWCGPNVPGINESTAQEYCSNNGLGYCKVVGELIAEIPCHEGTLEADMSRMVDYEKQSFN